ncbi:hypothetical protein ACHAWF_014696, partial [Thalassiosira exigua]
EEEGDPRRGSPPSSPPLLLEASPPSSAPSSPKPSPASAVFSAASSDAEPPSPRAEDEARRVDDAGRGDDGDDDPYADVRPRLEDLSRRDRRRLLAASTSESPTARVDHPDITVFAAITTYLGYVVLIVVGHARDKFANAFRRGRYFRSEGGPREREGDGETKPGGNGEDVDGRRFPSDDLARYAPLLKSWENFYTRRLYHRIQDCFNRPLASRPGARVAVIERVSYDGNKTMSVLGPLGGLDDRRRAAEYEAGAHYGSTADGRAVRKCLNLGSYNYLGFADDWDVTCRGDVLTSLRALPPSGGSCRSEFGTAALHREVERTVARFVGKDDALTLNMGFNTNATVVPALVGPGDLIVSDELNHTSIVNGARASGASIRTFRHNDASDLAAVLRESVVHGRPRTRRPWGKVLVVVEGIYSMEGEICDLRGVVRACKRYGAYVYLDEAHSIGALGRTGRGCCERCGVDPADVDVMMGTFTKSFGGMGGYVAADRGVIATLRRECAGSSYHNALSPAVCQQIVSSFRVSSFGLWVCWSFQYAGRGGGRRSSFLILLVLVPHVCGGIFDGPSLTWTVIWRRLKNHALLFLCSKRSSWGRMALPSAEESWTPSGTTPTTSACASRTWDYTSSATTIVRWYQSCFTTPPRSRPFRESASRGAWPWSWWASPQCPFS